jgi:exopolysaccharide biosynthesis WecB/TagA/CpsF family protein
MAQGFGLRIGAGSVVVNTPDRDALFSAIRGRLRQGAGFAVATLNLDHLVKLRASEAFREAYERHDLVVADGNPVVWLSRIARRPVALVPGADLVEPLTRLAAEEGVAVALVGATGETLADAGERLATRVPGLRIAARVAPGRGFDPDGEEAGEIIETLRHSGARLVLLALGAPRQERFAARARAALPGTGFVSIGAGLDFIAGSQRRAPAWVRRMALEWLWRMLSNPGRLARRYMLCALLLPRFALGALESRRAA